MAEEFEEKERAVAPQAHSEFPIPASWTEAWPIILWGMLALAFAFVIADSLTAIIADPLARAVAGFVALLGLTAVLIYRSWLWQKLSNPSPGLIIAVLCSLLWVLATSPFVEQKRWPFQGWFNQTDNMGPEKQKTTLIDWLKRAQKERDNATAERNSAQIGWSADRKAMASIQKEVNDLTAKLDDAEQKLAHRLPTLSPVTPQSITDPIRWGQLGFGFQGGPEPMFMDIEVLAEITGALPVEIKDAYIISGTTGEKLPMMLDAGKEGKIFPRDANPIPNEMSLYLFATLSPPLTGLQLLSKWGKVLFYAEYDGKKYEKTFDEEYMRNQLSRYPGSGLGPRITKREDVKSK
jgi:hypothetical protein